MAEDSEDVDNFSLLSREEEIYKMNTNSLQKSPHLHPHQQSNNLTSLSPNTTTIFHYQSISSTANMVSFTQILALSGLFASALALPANVERQVIALCSSGTAQCCDVDVLGVADLNCEAPPTIPGSLTEFNDVCASVGKIDMCCLIPILGQGLLCQSPTPN
ncbi:related to trihydrophobin precursor [Rhynchosporium agropyri]|uniref:Related to trihydrophobin n=2 Tax=Rhynchosporium TaxID=38037 RepID=A0A1E1LAZ9_9HELO|nr:related to trihydrophobin precursor [Rhynchosporium commune]CZT07751.1 related to trihydrophobin precursor [Rhynchosporium agropyri]